MNASAGESLPTGSDAKYNFVTVHGKLYGINKYCRPFVINPTSVAADKFDYVVPVDGFSASALHICYTQLPIARMIGTFNSRIIIGNFLANSGPYTTTSTSVSINNDGPLTVWLSEAITDLEQDVVFQVKEYFTFSEASGQSVVGQLEFRDRNLFFLSGSVWQLVGDTAENYTAVPITRNIGCVSALSIRETPYGVIWLSNDGFYLYDGTSAQKISDKIDPILQEMLYSYETNPYMIDRNRMWDACAVTNIHDQTYVAWIPIAAYDGQMLRLTYNYEAKAWTVGGKGCFTVSNGANTDEWGDGTRAAWMYTDSDNQQHMMTCGSDGWVHFPRTDGKDMYMELTANAANSSTSIVAVSATTFAFLGSANLDDVFNGATFTIVDDRTAAQKAGGTFPTGNNDVGTSRTVSDCAYNAGTGTFKFTLSSALAYTPLEGCTFSLHWPIRHRLIDEFGTENPDTVKTLRCIQIRAEAEAGCTVYVRYEGNPLSWSPDVPLLTLSSTKTITMKHAGDGAVTDRRVNCGPTKNTGRSIRYAIEYYGEGGPTIHGCLIESAVKGYK
jgi:hypothetical protein